MSESLAEGAVMLHCGDCLEVLATLDPNSLDACVTDPPYHLTSIVKRFATTSESDNTITSERVRNRSDGYARLVAGGFMGKTWDGGDIAFKPEVWAQVYRALKPGAYLVAFGGTRTYHRMACAIEDAGFDIRDTIMWLYGSGFPKSHDVSKGIDRAAGVEREKVRYSNPRNPKATGSGRDGMVGATRPWIEKAMEHGYHELASDIPATDAARQWEGWGTALKPACEPIVLARKPLSESTVAANVLKWGTGALNIDACRIHADDAQGGDYVVTRLKPGATLNKTGGNWRPEEGGVEYRGEMKPGRWPANVIHDGSEEVVGAFPESEPSSDHARHNEDFKSVAKGTEAANITNGVTDTGGSAARYFYSAKADSNDRLGSKHPTVKPLDLMQYLVRLVTPPKGLALDPFAGTGTTGEAAWREGMRAVLIEREEQYQSDIRRRMSLIWGGPEERARAGLKAAGKVQSTDDLPLFSMEKK